MSNASVFDVARYILEKQGPLTTMKLQKLAYYCQAWSLVWDGKPLFDEDFEAWANGPVSPQLFTEHRGKFIVNEGDLGSGPCPFDANEIDTIDTVLETYGDKEPQWLIELTHKERPWKDARRGCKDGDYCNNVIEKEAIQEYYSGLIV